ncbi:phage tail protein [Novosphingobium sp. YJ-S2-02]|uniref:Phage tail protein n=1 Tax=Novosphingobium aureum TaxID=2792964 RepID=A0A931MKD8_9SPHN|nr:phage tail protein [Novosphingobium aureum]MBH0112703.1 phage tail protein [Novosphingobium aureum]
MSKKFFGTVGKIAGIVAGVAMIGTGIGAALGGTMVFSALGASIAASTIATVAGAVSLGASMLSRPKAPATSSAAADRLSVSIDPRTPRKFVLGRTAMATDIRDQEFSSNQELLHRFLVAASHEVAGFEEIWFDDKLAWSASTGITSDYSGYLVVERHTVGSPAAAKNISTRMGTTRRYTGLAWVYLRFKLTGNSKKAQSPFAQSIPTRFTLVGKGALTYDPRLDSSVSGGSGSMRTDDQTTWAWDDNASRNPAIQLLWYLLGWRIQNPSTGEWRLAVGKGIPAARIDLASFITAANLCDEPVALADGGTQPRYRSDGVFSEGDATSTVLDQLKASMNAELDDVDGKIRITVLHDDLASPIADFTDDDVLDGFTWEQTAPLDETYNVVRGTFIDPSETSLYQALDYPEVRVDSPDGIDRVETVDFQAVQDPAQAQRLVKQRIARMLYSGRFTATFSYRAWKVQKNDVVRLTFGALGWTNKLFRVVQTSVQVDGRVPMVLQAEHADIYQWDRDERPAIQPVEPTRYDPFLNPVYQDLIEPKYDDGTPIDQLKPAEPGATVGATDEERARLDKLETAPTAYLTNDTIIIAAYSNGSVVDYSAATGSLVARLADGTDVSDRFVLTVQANLQDLSIAIEGRTYSITGGMDVGEDMASLTLRATGSGAYAGLAYDLPVTLTKSAGGYEIVGALPTDNLFAGRIVFLTSDSKLYRYDGNGWTAKFDADDLLGEVPRENIDPSLLSDISDLQEVYGDTESAAASAAAAQAAQSGAETARSLAQDAQSDAEAAQSASEQAKQDALDAAAAAGGSASAANTSAQTASTKAGEAGEKATAAAASATAAQTAAGNASSSATNAASSATNAGTSANSAASSATVAAKSVGYAESGALGNLVHKGRFSDNDIGEWTGSGLSVVNAPGLASHNISKALQLNGRDAYEGAAMREGNLNKRTLRFRGWVSTTGSAVAARIGLQLVLSDGSTVWRTAHLRDAGLDWASFDVNLNLNYTSLEVTSWRPWINNYGTAGVDTMTSRWAGLFLEDVTESNAAKGSADAAATSASTAATRANEASQSASAASTSETNAATSAGNASTFASQASTSASDALGSKNAAANSAGAAATSATNAGNSASAASTSAQTATTKAGEASQSASAAATSATNANTAAGNASTYAGQASNSADDADGSASAAAQSAGAAATSAGNAGNSASAAASSASSASTSASNAGASASSAASSASVAASTAAGLMNPNPMFADWLDGATYPTRWADWSGGAATISRIAGEVSPYAVRLGSVANDNRGISQTGANAPAALSAGDWVVIEADIKLNSGSLIGAGVLLRGTNTGECRLVFATDPDTKGNTIGAGSSGSVYRFRKLIQMPSGTNTAALFLMNHWSNFGSTASANDITWYRCGWRVASAAEIKTGQIDTLSASVTQQASALASVEGKTVAYWSVLANAGTSNAIIAARADGAGTSNVTMAAQKVVLANLAGTTLYDALVIENGNATLAGKLRAGAVVTDNLAAGAVTAAKINVTDLSAITGNIGTLTTGTIRNAADTYRIDATNGRSIMRAGGYMKVSGAPFGSNSQFLEWYGPEQANLANCTEANAIQYLKTDGSAYFGGSLSAGTLKNAGQSSSIASNASISIGPSGSNGNPISVALSYACRSTTTINYGNSSSDVNAWNSAVSAWGAATGESVNASKSIACNVVVRLERGLGGGAVATWTNLTITSCAETITGVRPVANDNTGYLTYTRTVSGSLTATDSAGTTQTRQFVATITDRSNGTNGSVTSQTISIVATEQ